MSAKESLLNWLSEDDLTKVFKGLSVLAKKYKDESLRESLIFQSGRFKELSKEKIRDTLSFEDEKLQSAKIRHAVLQNIQDLPNEWTFDGTNDSSDLIPPTSKMNWKKYTAVFTIIIGVVAGIAEISGYSIRDILEKKETIEKSVESVPTQSTSTSGDNSPAIITGDGDVEINYGDPQQEKDSAVLKQTSDK